MSPGFFTTGIDFELPHPNINERTVLLICQVLKRAWELLEQYPSANFEIQQADEDTITEQLVGIIENRLRGTGEVAGFNTALFGKTVREPKITNYNKEHPDKMPDMFFDLKRENLSVLSEQDGLFVECKPIDSTHPVFSCYCRKGLIRFVNGDYAWAMQQALMVGYARNSCSYADLGRILDNQGQEAGLNTVSHCTMPDETICQSVHTRDFQWLENRGRACNITVSHLWLRSTAQCTRHTDDTSHWCRGQSFLGKSRRS